MEDRFNENSDLGKVVSETKSSKYADSWSFAAIFFYMRDWTYELYLTACWEAYLKTEDYEGWKEIDSDARGVFTILVLDLRYIQNLLLRL